MSYYKVKYVSFNKKGGKIYVTCADSSLRPLYYEKSEFGSNISDFNEKCKTFWIETLSGNFQFTKSSKWYHVVETGRKHMQRITNYLNISEYDYLCKTNFSKQLQEYVSKTYLVPQVLKQEINPDETFENQFLSNCKKEWNRIAHEWEINKKIPIRSALISSMFPGWDSLLHYCKDRTIIAKKQNYNNSGLLDNADQTAIILPIGSGKDWGKIAYAEITDLPELIKLYPQLMNAVTPEATYQSEERAIMDGYIKIGKKENGIILFAQKEPDSNITWAEVVGYGEVI